MPQKRIRKPARHIRWLIVAVVVAVMALAGGLAYYTHRVTPRLSQRLRSQVLKSSDSLYHVEFSDLRVNPFSGTIMLSSFRLTPDTAVYSRMKARGEAPENIVDLYVPEVRLAHAHPLRLLFFRKVLVGDVKIEYPVIRIRHEDHLLSDKNQSIQKALGNLISGPLTEIHINRLDLDNVKLTYKNLSNPQGKGFLLEKADVIFRDLAIDRQSVADTSRLLYARDCWIHLVQFGMPTADSLYQLGIGDLVYDVRDRKMLIQGFTVKPRYDEAGFDRMVGRQQDRYALEVDSVTADGLGLLDILRTRKIGRVSRLSFDGVRADIYHNRQLPPAPGDKPLLGRALRKAAGGRIFRDIRTLFTIDTINLRRTEVTYRERSQLSERIGQVNFDQLAASFYHLSDEAPEIARHRRMTGDVQARFMDRAQAHVHFVFDLASDNDAFSYAGSLSAMKAPVLNKATVYLGLLRIRSGDIDTLRFRFEADDSRATGQVHLLYQELSISILSLDEISGRLKKKGLASLMANLLVLRNNNITDTGAIRQAEVVYPHDPSKSIFNYMWKSLFQGVKVIVGMDTDVSQLKEDFQHNSLLEKIRKKKQARTR